MTKYYYKITFRLKSALSLGNGENIYTDKDIIKNNIGEPFIPGTALAGVYRSLYRDFKKKEYIRTGQSGTEEQGQNAEQKEQEKIKSLDATVNKIIDQIFGKVDIATKENTKIDAIQSKLYVYDAYLVPQTPYKISKRDCVGLDQYKIAISGAKFDFEMLEAGAQFVTYIEQDVTGENVAEWIASVWKRYGLSIGAKTKRGLGETEIISIQYASFDLSKNSIKGENKVEKSGEESEHNGLDDWISFDMYDNKDTKYWKAFEAKDIARWDDEINIDLLLKQKSGISIRQYTTDISGQGEIMPDYKQITYRKDNKTFAFIPGTTWSGAFYHQMRELGASEEDLKLLFGSHCKIDNSQIKQERHKSQIRFSESEIEIAEGKGQYKTISRTAIDRFTGGAKNGALYTERYVYGGETRLQITVPKQMNDMMKKTLAATITDLHNGFLAIGGLTSVGRGLFEVVEVNEKKVNNPETRETTSEIYPMIMNIPKIQEDYNAK